MREELDCLNRLRRGSRARLRRRDSAEWMSCFAGEEGLEMGSLRVWEGVCVGSEGDRSVRCMCVDGIGLGDPMERAKSLICLGFITAVGN